MCFSLNGDVSIIIIWLDMMVNHSDGHPFYDIWIINIFIRFIPDFRFINQCLVPNPNALSTVAHAMMVKRIIGNKPGTGGSVGYSYLRSTVRLVLGL